MNPLRWLRPRREAGEAKQWPEGSDEARIERVLGELRLALRAIPA